MTILEILRETPLLTIIGEFTAVAIMFILLFAALIIF